MRIVRISFRVLLVIFLIVIIAGGWYCWSAFPLISGYGTKNLASAIYVQHRNANDVMKEDLGDFPLSLASFMIHREDSSVIGSVWGFAKQKAIYRKGAGCTLVNDFSESEIRNQHFDFPDPPSENFDSIPWPRGNKITDSIPSSVNKDLLQQSIDRVINENDNNNKPVYTRAVIVLYDGKIIGEQYAKGFDRNSVMLGWSVSKSLTGAMIGVLVKDGKLDINKPAPVPEWENTDREKITLKQLLQQTSGLDFREIYTGPSEVTNMLFKRGDMAAYTASLQLKYEPGAMFNYSSGNSNILSRIIRQTVGGKDYNAFPYKSLFYKCNIYSMLLEPDASGTYIGSSYSYATARDFARFGLLYYNNGKWGNEQILPEDWVKETIQSSDADKRKHYGLQFWLNGYDKNNPAKRWYPDAPADMYFADGFGGQDIYIIPSRKLVVARFGLHAIDENRFLKEVIAAIKE
ncbi:MAG TPA: serine hydrolase [Puia sp.]|nr:serine hydrolase [Puia sp.]